MDTHRATTVGLVSLNEERSGLGAHHDISHKGDSGPAAHEVG